MNPTVSGRRAALSVLTSVLVPALLVAGTSAGLSAASADKLAPLPRAGADRGALVRPSVPQAQPSPVIWGIVVDRTGAPVEGAALSCDGGSTVLTDVRGRYELAVPAAGCQLQVSHPNFEPVTRTVAAGPARTRLDLTLVAVAYRYEENIVVRAVRAEATSPLSLSDLPRAEVRARNYGQEVPFLLKEVPSLTEYAEAGSSTGYSYLSLRGIQQTRLNMTLDGVPLNEPEDSAVYFSNYGDLAASIDSIQVQRGVGTSSAGAASYGGSINFASLDPGDVPSVAAEIGSGSFATTRAAVTLNSGKVGPGLAFYGRASYRDTDGYRDHAGARQQGLFWGMTRRGDRSFLKGFGFIGRSRTQLVYLAVEPDVLAVNPRSNPMSPAERDDFTQSLSSVQYTRFIGSRTSVAGQAYYQRASGWYRIFADPSQTSLYQYGLAWQYGGGMINLQHVAGGFTLTAGGHGYAHASRHTRDVVDLGRDYANRGFKVELDGFAKAAWQRGRASLWGDLQVRHARFRYEGDVHIGEISWTFFNPKAGARWRLRPGLSVFASVGLSSREPTRGDMLAGQDNPTLVYDLRAVKPERATDVEAGLAWRAGAFSVSANLYAMEFRNEIALTGELSDIGMPLRRNVGRSHRRGVEFDAGWRAARWLRLATTASLSHDRIARWTQFYDVYDVDGNWSGSAARQFTNVRPLLSPGATFNQRVELTPKPWLEASVSGRWIASAWLDNTNTGDLTTPRWFGLDASAAVSLSRWIARGTPRLRIQLDNALNNRRIYPSGYSYQYLVDPGTGAPPPAGVPYYYPQATRSIFVGLDVKM